MLDIVEAIENALSTDEYCIFKHGEKRIPVYDHMPEFSVDEAPDNYIVYSYYDIPKLEADNRERCMEYSVTLHIVSKEKDRSVFRLLRRRMEDFDFCYQGSINQLIADFPEHFDNVQEYKIVLELEE